MAHEIITTEALSDLRHMFTEVCKIAKELAEENKALKTKKWLDSKEVAAMTGYSFRTIAYKKKHEIGFRSEGGKDLKFHIDDVNAYMQKYYIKAK